MKRSLRSICVLALATASLAVTPALCDDLSLPLVVTDVKAPVTDWAVAFDVDFAETAICLDNPPKVDPARVQVWETDASGKATSQKWAQFVPAGEGDGRPASAGTIFWLMDGTTNPGTERRFIACTKGGSDRTGAPAGVSVRRSDSRLVVNNGRYEVVHDLKKGGTIVEIAFLDSSNRVLVQMKDSMRAKEWFEIAQDDEPIVTVRAATDSSPVLGAIVEVQTHFARLKVDRSEWPSVTYRYIYSANSPLVRIESVVPEQTASQKFGNVQQFVFDVGKDNPFTRVGRVVTSGTGTLMETKFKWSPCEARPPAGTLMANEVDALGIITPVIGSYSIDKEGMHIRSRGFLSTWMGAELRTGATLYIGPTATADQYLPLAEPPRVRAVIAPLEKRIAAARQKTQDTGGAAVEMLLRAAEQRIEVARQLKRAEELVTAAESLVSIPRRQQSPTVVETESFLALANSQTGLLFAFGPEKRDRVPFFGGVRLEGMYRRGHAFLRPAAGDRAFWRAWCRDTQTKGWVGVSPAQATGVERRVERQNGRTVRLRLRWPRIEAGPGSVRAEVTIVLDSESPLSRWKIAIEPDGERLSLWEVAFPIVAGIEGDGGDGGDGSAGETDFLVFPYKGGARLPNPACAGLWELMYPGAAGWQFLAYWQGRDGLYVGAHDRGASVKTLKSLPTGDGTLELRMTHPVPNMGLPGTGFDMPFECMVGSFEGDWYDGTQVYREWLLKQEWVPRKPLHANEDIPEWVKDSCVATRRSGLPERAIHTWIEEHASGFKEYHMGVAEEHEALGSPPTLMWWYHAWHPREGVSRKFADSPDFLAPPRFADGVRELKQRDIRVVSYSLSYWWDYSAPSWKKENAERAVIIREDGSQWLYHRRGVGIMCPAAELYQQKMQRVMHQLLDQGPVDGTYFDLGGTSGAASCYSKEHGHPVGSGSFPTAGKRDLMRGMRAAARARNPEFALIMEGNADCYLDAIDGYALFAGNVPVRHALYSDYLRPAGAKRCLVERSPLEALNPAKHLAWGALLGRLYGKELLTRDKTEPGKVAYYKRLVRHKLVARPWLNYGRMLRPLRLTHVDPPDPAEFVEGTMVPTGTWQAPNGTVAFVFANARQSVEVSFRYTIDPGEYNIPADGSAALYKLTPEGEVPKPRLEKQMPITGPVARRETLPAGGVLALIAQPQ